MFVEVVDVAAMEFMAFKSTMFHRRTPLGVLRSSAVRRSGAFGPRAMRRLPLSGGTPTAVRRLRLSGAACGRGLRRLGRPRWGGSLSGGRRLLVFVRFFGVGLPIGNGNCQEERYRRNKRLPR